MTVDVLVQHDEAAHRRGYVVGYDGALRAFERLFHEPGMRAETALKRADHHLLCALEDWLDDPSNRPVPGFEAEPAGTGAYPGAAAPLTAGTRRDFRRGYLEGWDAGIDAVCYLVFGQHVTPASALTCVSDYLETELCGWQRGDDAGKPPRLDRPGVSMWQHA